MSARYIVYHQPALENLDGMGNRMSSRLESQIEDFLTVFKTGENAFSRQLKSHLYQFKWSPRHGSGARAFSGYINQDGYEIALVLVTFKKKNEDQFNSREEKFNERARGYEDRMKERDEEEMSRWMTEQMTDDNRKVLSNKGN